MGSSVYMGESRAGLPPSLWFYSEVLQRPDSPNKTQTWSSSAFYSLLFRQQRDQHGLQLSRDSVFFGYVWPLSRALHQQAWEERV